jgi:hypothetical protein
MNPELINRLVSLVERTGDRVVLADPTTGKAVVVMDLNSYERLCVPAQSSVALEIPVAPIEYQKAVEIAVPSQISRSKAVKPPIAARSDLADLTHEELMDKINRDIGAWKEAQESRTRAEELGKKSVKQPAAKVAVEPGAGSREPKATAQMEDEERFYLEPIE